MHSFITRAVALPTACFLVTLAAASRGHALHRAPSPQGAAYVRGTGKYPRTPGLPVPEERVWAGYTTRKNRFTSRRRRRKPRRI